MPKASWRHEEGNFEGAHGTQIYYQGWTPAGKPKAIVVLAHGIREHSGRYAHVAGYMARNSFALWACDHRVTGDSGPTLCISAFPFSGLGTSQGTLREVVRFHA